jgi:hypothetical protein
MPLSQAGKNGKLKSDGAKEHQQPSSLVTNLHQRQKDITSYTIEFFIKTMRPEWRSGKI